MTSMTRSLPKIVSLFACVLLLLPTWPVHAEEVVSAEESIVSIPFDAGTISRGYTIESSDGLMRLGIRPGTLNVSTRVDVKTLAPSLMEGTYDKFLVPPSVGGRKLLGNVYLFDILEKSSYEGKDFFFLEIKYPTETVLAEGDARLHGRRKIYFWNGVSSAWEELPSEDSPSTNSVRALIYLPYARLAIFEDPVPSVGLASWYTYKGCDCAASPDYPKGTFLVVTRVDDPTRSVTVKVNDWGPDRTIHPERVIDLDKVAFQKIANTRGGVVEVMVNLLQ